MLRAMRGMPVGTFGFEAIGSVDDDDWEKTVEPALRREIAEGRKVRMLYLLGPEARDVDGDALMADAGFRARHASSFERVAVVSDEDWLRPALESACRSCCRARPRASGSASSRTRRPGWRTDRISRRRSGNGCRRSSGAA